MKFSLQFSARDTILTAVQVSDFAHGPSVLMYIDIMFIFFGGISETIPCLARTLSCTPLIQCRHGDQSKSDPFTSVYFKKNEIKTYSQYVLLRIYRIEKKNLLFGFLTS